MMSNILALCNACVMEGEFGAAATLFNDAHNQVVMNSFPYCSWRQDDVAPSLHSVESSI